jgi:hypothetical protein
VRIAAHCRSQEERRAPRQDQGNRANRCGRGLLMHAAPVSCMRTRLQRMCHGRRFRVPRTSARSASIERVPGPLREGLSGEWLSRRPKQRLGDDDVVTVERDGRAAVKLVADRECFAHPPAERVVVGSCQDSVGRQAFRWRGLRHRSHLPRDGTRAGPARGRRLGLERRANALTVGSGVTETAPGSICVAYSARRSVRVPRSACNACAPASKESTR